MKEKKRNIVRTIWLMVLSLVASASLTYAWHISIYNFAQTHNVPGELTPEISLAHYNYTTSSWQNSTSAEPLSIYLGEMTNIAQLPANSNTYLKIRINETSDAQTKYNVIVNNIETVISNIDGVHAVTSVDYFAAENAQNVFDFYVYTSTSDNLNPLTVFANLQTMTPFKITTLPHALLSNSATLDTRIYILLKPDIAKVQNIIRLVPIQLSPYNMVFRMSLNGEVKTLDENA